MDPKLSSVLSSLPTAVEYSLVMRREGSGRQTRLRRRKDGGGGSEWIAGCGLDQSKRLLRTGDTDQIRCSPKADLTVCVWWDLSPFASSVSLPPEALSSFGLFRSDAPAKAMNHGRRGASSEEGSGGFNSVATVISFTLLAAN
ncbi:hypothetical protein IGI04_039839 [Brassica rapa subsp. trilocularis]|uniref:Uncharacterized protein n=1 Tax=Brassica rapa subsp. trilocularis TaxID=1813537 RepID=A0ABQ7KLZ8_BRACM|nr:hypothetical protein IGI04_039839 [Brassica rapa subsp. trilocularis]